MAEKDQFLQTWDREFQTTLKVLRAYPADKADLKPHAKLPTAKELAWRIVGEEPLFINGTISGKFDFMNQPKAPPTLAEVIATYERNHWELVEKVKKLSNDDFHKIVPFMVAPKTMGNVRSGDLFWLVIMDSIHHRGQFSVYLRLADGKVPSIYGPTADEPWM